MGGSQFGAVFFYRVLFTANDAVQVCRGVPDHLGRKTGIGVTFSRQVVVVADLAEGGAHCLPVYAALEEVFPLARARLEVLDMNFEEAGAQLPDPLLRVAIG